jgi:hypothetical protein
MKLKPMINHINHKDNHNHLLMNSSASVPHRIEQEMVQFLKNDLDQILINDLMPLWIHLQLK